MASGWSNTWMPAVMLLLAACEPADDVRVQPLPSLQRLSAEARAGLPEVAGVWRFAGWELAEGDSASLARDDLPGLGQIWLQTQRLDSVGGAYVAPGGRFPLLGEVRRDSIVSLVALAGGGEGYYLAGRYAADTLWVRLTSLVEPGTWPAQARAAFVRSQVATPFVRLQGAPPPQLAADTLPDSTAVPTVAGAAPPPAGAGVDTLRGRPPTPATGAAVAVPRPGPAQPRPQTSAPPQQTAPQQARPQQPPPQAAQPRPREEEPEPEVEVEVPPPPTLPPLLGEPVEPDSIIPR